MRLADGRYVPRLESEPEKAGSARALSISEDGLVFTKMIHLVGGRHVDYPHVIEHGDNLYIAFAGGKQTVEVLKVKLADLDAVGYARPSRCYTPWNDKASENNFPMKTTPILAFARPSPAPSRGEDTDWKLKRLSYNHPASPSISASDSGPGPCRSTTTTMATSTFSSPVLTNPPTAFTTSRIPPRIPRSRCPSSSPASVSARPVTTCRSATSKGRPASSKRNQEYVDFKTKGFDKPETIYKNGKFHPGNTRARMWRYVDYENDGDQDLIVGIGDWSDYVWDQAYDSEGRWRNGPLHGYIYLIENNGGKYSDNPAKIEAGGSPIDVFGWPSPNFGDFDGDGDLDLLCGEFLDGFTYFENSGTRGEPVYGVGRRLSGSDAEPLVMHLQMITPTRSTGTATVISI